MTEFIADVAEPARNVVACGGEFWDGFGRPLSSIDATSRCDAFGCVWWSVRDGEADMASRTELCGTARTAKGSSGASLGFHVCYWLEFDKRKTRWRIVDAVVKGIT